MNRLNKSEFAIFLHSRFSLFLKDPFFPDYLEVATAVERFFVELVKLLHVHRYSVDIFHILALREYWVLTSDSSTMLRISP